MVISYFCGLSQIGKTQIPIDEIYIGPPDIASLDRNIIQSIAQYPKNIGYGKIEEKLEEFKDKPEIKIAIINALSHAIGDNLVGMRAFDFWRLKVQELLPNTKIVISFFKINPRDITKQYNSIDHVYSMPCKLKLLLEHDAFIDLGPTPEYEIANDFQTMNMIDFYLKSFSIDPETVPPEFKRMKYEVSEEIAQEIKKVLDK